MNQDIDNAVRAVSDAVNRMGGWEPQEFAEGLANDHRTLIQLKTDVFIRFLRLVAAGGSDPRNEEAKKRASIMVAALDAAGIDHDGMPFI